jgi:glycine oxidase
MPSVAVRPVKGQIIRLRATSRSLAPTHVVRGSQVYLVPRPDGEVVVGATVEERGEDLTVTAGAVHELLRAAWELVPGIAEMELVETAAGLRPATPDNRPLIGPCSEGPVVATGHYRNGILLAPITADAVVALLTGGDLIPEVEAFAPEAVP